MIRENKLNLTRQGRDLIAMAIAGHKIEFTRAVFSDKKRLQHGGISIDPIGVVVVDGSINVRFKIENIGAKHTIEIESVAIMAKPSGSLAGEIKFADVTFSHPDFIIPESLGYDYIEYNFVFALSEALDSEPVKIVIKRNDISEKEVRYIAKKESKRDLKKIDNIEYNIYTSLNALSLMSHPPDRRTALRLKRWLRDTRARKKDWRRFKRMVDHERLYEFSNKIRAILVRPAKYSSNTNLIWLGRILMMMPILLPIFGPIVSVLFIIIGIIFVPLSIIAAVIFDIIFGIWAALAIIVEIILVIIEIPLIIIYGILIFLLDIITLLPLQLYNWFFGGLAFIFIAIIPWIIQTIATIIEIILIIIAVLVFLPTLGIGTVIVIILMYVVVVIASPLAAGSAVIGMVFLIIHVLSGIFSMPIHIIALLYTIIPHLAAWLPVIFGLPLAIFLLSIMGVEAVSIIVLLVLFILLLFLPFWPFLGMLLIRLGKTRRGNLIVDRNTRNIDRKTRLLSRRRIR